MRGIFSSEVDGYILKILLMRFIVKIIGISSIARVPHRRYINQTMYVVKSGIIGDQSSRAHTQCICTYIDTSTRALTRTYIRIIVLDVANCGYYALPADEDGYYSSKYDTDCIQCQVVC